MQRFLAYALALLIWIAPCMGCGSGDNVEIPDKFPPKPSKPPKRVQ